MFLFRITQGWMSAMVEVLKIEDAYMDVSGRAMQERLPSNFLLSPSLNSVVLALPEPPATPAHIPVRQTVHKRLNMPARISRVIRIQPIIDIYYKLIKLRENPSVKL